MATGKAGRHQLLPGRTGHRAACALQAVVSAIGGKIEQPFDTRDVEVVAGHAGPAYGVPRKATIEAIELGARLEALVLGGLLPTRVGSAIGSMPH